MKIQSEKFMLAGDMKVLNIKIDYFLSYILTLVYATQRFSATFYSINSIDDYPITSSIYDFFS